MSKECTIRVAGTESSKDVELTKYDKANLEQMLQFADMLIDAKAHAKTLVPVKDKRK